MSAAISLLAFTTFAYFQNRRIRASHRTARNFSIHEMKLCIKQNIVYLGNWEPDTPSLGVIWSRSHEPTSSAWELRLPITGHHSFLHLSHPPPTIKLPIEDTYRGDWVVKVELRGESR
jgi:hypothetical protein